MRRLGIQFGNTIGKKLVAGGLAKRMTPKQGKNGSEGLGLVIEPGIKGEHICRGELRKALFWPSYM